MKNIFYISGRKTINKSAMNAKIIVALTMKEILDEQIAKKLV